MGRRPTVLLVAAGDVRPEQKYTAMAVKESKQRRSRGKRDGVAGVGFSRTSRRRPPAAGVGCSGVRWMSAGGVSATGREKPRRQAERQGRGRTGDVCEAGVEQMRSLIYTQIALWCCLTFARQIRYSLPALTFIPPFPLLGFGHVPFNSRWLKFVLTTYSYAYYYCFIIILRIIK